LTEWARAQGLHPQTAHRWFREGRLPVPAVRVNSRFVLVAPDAVIVPARGAQSGRAVVRVEAEVGSGMNGARPKTRRLLAAPGVQTVVAGQRDRLGRVNTGSAGAALGAHGRGLVVLDPDEVDDDLVRDVTEFLTSLCARLYGRRAVANRARRAVEAVTGDVP
jgi:putative resolvase